MEETNNTPKEVIKNHSLYIYIIIIILVSGLSGYYWMYTELSSGRELLNEAQNSLQQKESENAEMMAKMSEALNKIEEIEADRALLNETILGYKKELPKDTYGAEKTVKFVSPSGPEQLCMNENYFIEWEAPEKMISVELIIRRSGDAPIYALTIGSYPATYNEANTPGVGRLPWTVGEVISQYGQTSVTNPITPGPAYEIIIKGVYNNKYVVDVSDVFSIIDCRG